MGPPLDLQRKKAIPFEIVEISTTKAIDQVQKRWKPDPAQPLHATLATALQENINQHTSKICRPIFNVAFKMAATSP